MEICTEYVDIPEGAYDDDYEISVFEDEHCETRVEEIDFGPITPGEEKIIWRWIKNTGKVPAPKVFVGRGVINSEGWISESENYQEGPLEVGEKKEVPFCLKVEEDAEIGMYYGKIPVTVYGTEEFF
ncbi:MAG: hypothetical protein R6U61_02000 [Thermoplasmata archaeon]